MKILVVTFTRGVNPGTIMQALGVQTAFRLLYPSADIEFLNFPDFKRGKLSVRGKSDSILSTFLQKGFAAYRLLRYKSLRNRYFKYSPAVDIFHYDDKSIAFIKQYDLVVIGSDTILEQAYSNTGKIGLNWMPINIKKLYFAASASPANFAPKSDLKKVAEKAVFIGLRDDLTMRLFVDKLKLNPHKLLKQPDPSYFLDISKFKLPSSLASKIKTGKKHVLYNFNSNFPQRKELADKLRHLGYKVVSTAYNPYADICFDTINAFEWAGVFPLIDIVVTERFHDSVFALRNCKPVIAIDWDKNRFASEGDSKTYCILEDYGLTTLHFNLSVLPDLDAICKAIETLEHVFDKQHVKNVNEMLTRKANDELYMIERLLRN